MISLPVRFSACYTSYLILYLSITPSDGITSVYYTNTVVQCALQCAREDDCTSFSYMTTSEPPRLCATDSYDIRTGTSSLVSNNNFVYYSIYHPSVVNIIPYSLGVRYADCSQLPCNMQSGEYWIGTDSVVLTYCEVHVYDSCATIPDDSASGTYCVDPEASGAPFHVWCEMDIDGGHWTLVYSYEVSDQNAVNPAPNWYTTRTVQPISTTTPITDDQLGAMEFSQWQTFGDVVLMKSAQALTLTCQPFVGNIVRYLPGRLDCRVLDQQESLGCTVFSLPFQFRVRGCGPYIKQVGSTTPRDILLGWVHSQRLSRSLALSGWQCHTRDHPHQRMDLCQKLLLIVTIAVVITII